MKRHQLLAIRRAGLTLAAVMWFGLFSPFATASSAPGTADGDGDIEEAKAIVERAKLDAVQIPAQADALADLAWPAEGVEVEPLVRELARDEIVVFSKFGTDAVHRIIKTRPQHSADAVTALIEQRYRMDSGLPRNFGPALVDAVWFGNREARLIAFEEMPNYVVAWPILPIMDAAEEDPSLIPAAIEALGRLRNDKARFWLEKHLRSDDPDERRRAAMALSAIGNRAFEPLREAMKSDDRDLREVAATALIPNATVEQLTALYEYITEHPDDSPGIVEAARARAIELEKALDAPLPGS